MTLKTKHSKIKKKPTKAEITARKKPYEDLSALGRLAYNNPEMTIYEKEKIAIGPSGFLADKPLKRMPLTEKYWLGIAKQISKNLTSTEFQKVPIKSIEVRYGNRSPVCKFEIRISEETFGTLDMQDILQPLKLDESFVKHKPRFYVQFYKDTRSIVVETSNKDYNKLYELMRKDRGEPET